VPGNHDYFAGIKRSIDLLDQAGIVVLRNNSLIIDSSFYLIGRDDEASHNRKSLDSLMQNIDPDFPLILMDHRPFRLHESSNHKIDLHLSGHLHNGQIFPVNIIEKKKYELSFGYLKTDSTNFYVSSGLGLSYVPLRIGTYSEIVRIHLTMKNNSIAKTTN